MQHEAPAYFERPILPETIASEADAVFSREAEVLGATEDGRPIYKIPFSELKGLTQAIIDELGPEHIVGNPLSVAASLLRERYVMNLLYEDPRRGDYDIQVYNSCKHGVIPASMELIIQLHPDDIYDGDDTGSKFEGDTKMIYYNEIINLVRPKVKDKTMASADLVKVLEAEPNDLWKKLQESFFKLYSYLWEYEGRDDAYISEQRDYWRPGKIAEWLLAQLQDGMNHGYWIGGLERATREKFLRDVGLDTLAVITANEPLGDHVHHGVGNWDMRETLEIFRWGKKNPDDPGDPTPIEVQFFTIPYLREHGKDVHEDVFGVETPATLTIVAPFPALRKRGVADYPMPFSLERKDVVKVLQQAVEAHRKGKLVVIYAHASLEHLNAGPDNGDVARNFLELMKQTHADVGAYLHEHRVRTGKDGKPIPINHHTVYQYHDSDSPTVVTDYNKLGDDDQVVTVYMPYLNAQGTRANPRTAVGIYRHFKKYENHGRHNHPISGINSLPPKVL